VAGRANIDYGNVVCMDLTDGRAGCWIVVFPVRKASLCQIFLQLRVRSELVDAASQSLSPASAGKQCWPDRRRL
jgi:hypothetical protein